MSDPRTRTIRQRHSLEVAFVATALLLMTTSMAVSQALPAAPGRRSPAAVQSTTIPAPAAATATGVRRNNMYDVANSVAAVFSLQAYDGGGVQAGSVAVGDLNGDGGLDLAVTNQCTFTWMSCEGGGSLPCS